MSKPDFAQPTLFGDLPEVVNPEVAKKPKKAEKKIVSSPAVESVVPNKAPGAFKTISEAAKILSIPQHVLRFWETKFRQIRPLKLKGGRRYYRPEDIDTLQTIKHLLYKEGYTINGARKAFDAARRRGVASDSKIKTRKSSIKMPEIPNTGSADNQKEILKIRDELVALRKTLHTTKSKA